jgi:hypothetical protein
MTTGRTKVDLCSLASVTAVAAGPDMAIFVGWLFWHIVLPMGIFDERRYRLLD